VFLACDMPFVSSDLLRHIAARLGGKRAVFASVKAVPGFPFVVRTTALPVVEAQLRSGKLSLRELARALGARLTPVPLRLRPALANLNTPEEWSRAQARGTRTQGG
jgi:CTP:molybdopterin cytidylyltransferase MocA